MTDFWMLWAMDPTKNYAAPETGHYKVDVHNTVLHGAAVSVKCGSESPVSVAESEYHECGAGDALEIAIAGQPSTYIADGVTSVVE